PDGLTIRRWFAGPGQLRVSWFRDDRDAADSDQNGRATDQNDGSNDGGTNGGGGSDTVAGHAPELSQASYAITDSRALNLHGYATGFAPIDPDSDATRKTMTIGGHDAVVTLDRFESGAGQARVTSVVARWQLANGKWIHAWVA